MPSGKLPLTASITFPILLAMASPAHPDSDPSIVYGTVNAQTRVNVKDHVAEGAMVGGILGVATSSIFATGSTAGNAILGSATGAATGAAVEYLGERRMRGTRYTISTHEGQVIHIISDQEPVNNGDCVAVESDREHANIRRVSAVYCDTRGDIPTDPHLAQKAESAARDCRAAKTALLAATQADEVEKMVRRVRALCDT